MHGIICMWSGVISDIPDGWALCDGTNGTPDISSRFIRPAQTWLAPHLTGGEWEHQHTCLLQDQIDSLELGDEIQSYAPEGHYLPDTMGHKHTGTTTFKWLAPPYYTLCFIMKL